jgi:hypothetical protein
MKKRRIGKYNQIAYSAICWIQDRDSGAAWEGGGEEEQSRHLLTTPDLKKIKI